MTFYRASGAGNDFLALVEPGEAPQPEEIRAWCARGLSLGADGLFLLSRRPGGVGMEYFNADGRPAELCLNGTRCAARLAFHLGWAEVEVEVLTGGGPVPARRTGPDAVALTLDAPGEPRAVAPEVEGAVHDGLLLAVGVPHLVLPWTGDMAEAPVAALGPRLRAHPAVGPAGANVDFVRYAGPHRLEIRSYERGVEAETLACGTGVLAAVAAGLARGEVELPVTALTRGGFELEVTAAAAEGGRERWSLTGDARLVARGTLLPGATGLPASPGW